MDAKTSTYHYRRRQAARLAGPHIACACGCGTLIPAIGSTGKPRTYATGHNPASRGTRFQSGHEHSRKGHERLRAEGRFSGPGNVGWKGGVRLMPKGYVVLLVTAAEAGHWPTAHRFNKTRTSCYIQRSHKVWNEAHPNDPVQLGDEVHHENLIRDDDRVENLRKMTKDEHRKLHPKGAAH